MIENKIGYVAVFEFNAQEQEEVDKYADNIQNLIIELDKQAVCRWIVDLRDDNGGNMYPMIAGLGALIGEGELGSFKDASDQLVKWYYRDGQSWYENEPAAKVNHPEFLLDPHKTPVAVLIGPYTASSGEATALSFHGRPITRLFGKDSYGLTTGNEAYPLDVVTSEPVSDATLWLLDQPACKSQ